MRVARHEVRKVEQTKSTHTNSRKSRNLDSLLYDAERIKDNEERLHRHPGHRQ